MSRNLGYIGLGVMGLPFARHLAAAGHRVAVHDVDAAAVSRAVSFDNIAAAAGVTAVAGASEIVFTCLPSPEAVESVYAELDKPGLTCCDNSTIDPNMAKRLHASLKERGMGYVECPMLGGAKEAEAGRLFLLLSGDAADIERILPVATLAAREYRVVGGPGVANRFKVVQNGLGHVQAVAIAEALAILAKAGADLDLFIDVVRAGGGMAATPLFSAKASMMRDPTPVIKGSLRICAKDVGLAAALAQELGLELPLLRRASEVYGAAMEQGLGNQDMAAIARVVEGMTGTRIARSSD